MRKLNQRKIIGYIDIVLRKCMNEWQWQGKKPKEKRIQCLKVIKIMLAHKCKASKQGLGWAVNQLFTSFIWHITKLSIHMSILIHAQLYKFNIFKNIS